MILLLLRLFTVSSGSESIDRRLTLSYKRLANPALRIRVQTTQSHRRPKHSTPPSLANCPNHRRMCLVRKCHQRTIAPHSQQCQPFGIVARIDPGRTTAVPHSVWWHFDALQEKKENKNLNFNLFDFARALLSLISISACPKYKKIWHYYQVCGPIPPTPVSRSGSRAVN